MVSLIFGEDSFQSNRYIKSTINTFKKENAGASLLSFNMSDKDASIDKILLSIGSGGLFSQKKLILVEGLLENSNSSEQRKLIEKIEPLAKDPDINIVFLESKIPRKNNALYKEFAKFKAVQEFKYLSEQQMIRWMKEFLKKESLGCEITDKAAYLLSAYIGSDLYALSNEIKKLSSYNNFNSKIDEKDVELFVRSKVESNIFQAIEAVIEKDKKRALGLFHDQIRKGEDPFYIFSMYIYQFRTMLKISLLMESGMLNESDIARAAKLHPFVVKKSIQRIKSISASKIRLLYKKILDIDIGIKTGKKEIVLALDTFIASI